MRVLISSDRSTLFQEGFTWVNPSNKSSGHCLMGASKIALSAVWCSVSASLSRVSMSAREYQGLLGGAAGGGGGPRGGTERFGRASMGDCRLGAVEKLNTSGGAANANLRKDSCPVVLTHNVENSTSCRSG